MSGTAREKARIEHNREFRALELSPPPTLGEPGEFRIDARKQRKILKSFRAIKDHVARYRAAGGDGPPPLAGRVKARKAVAS